MREIRLYGSEGGGAIRFSLPLSSSRAFGTGFFVVPHRIPVLVKSIFAEICNIKVESVGRSSSNGLGEQLISKVDSDEAVFVKQINCCSKV